MRTRIIFTVAIAVFFAKSAEAQYDSKAPNSDRPGQAINPNTVGNKVVQLQSGVRYNPWSFNGGPTQHAFGTAHQLRLGIAKKWEVNAAMNFDWGRSDSFGMQDWYGNFSNYEVGVRNNLINGKGIIPVIGGNFSLFVPGNVNAFGQKIMISQSNRWKRISVNGNFGFIHLWNFDTDAGSWSYPYVLNVGFNLSDDLSAFVEIFGVFENISNPFFDGGLNWNVGKNFSLDLFGGWLGSDVTRSWFVEGGMTYRLDWR